MHISVRKFEGTSIELEVESTDTVQSIKEKIRHAQGIRVDLQRLMFNNQPIQNSQKLSDCGVCADSVLYLVLRNAENSTIVAGGYGEGIGINQLGFPSGIAIGDNHEIFIADSSNHRIIKWQLGEANGRTVTGENVQGRALNQLCHPTDVLIDKQTNSLIIADSGNKRVLRWSLAGEHPHREILLDNIDCWGLAMDHEGYLYVSNIKHHEVRRYQIRHGEGVCVAGGGDRPGIADNQLNKPTFIFVDGQKSIYVSDSGNRRVMKWSKDAKAGVLVARVSARGLVVDQSETLYVADYDGHQVVYWPKDAQESHVLSHTNLEDDQGSQLFRPWGLACGVNNFLYVADHSGHNIRRFPVKNA